LDIWMAMLTFEEQRIDLTKAEFSRIIVGNIIVIVVDMARELRGSSKNINLLE
jgi:hypothetical protein